ncbi:MAG: hypothetical protein WEB04_09010 [Dehalococcoidia bacterium]
MIALRLVTKLCTLAGALASIALLHHGHVQAFIADVYASLRRKLPASLRKHKAVLKPSLAQVYFDDPSVHYEVWVQRKTRSIEIGLHFEGEREANARWAELLSERAPEIARALGPSAELETWTRSWTRLHESRPIEGDEWRPKYLLTPELVEEAAARLARYIEVLEPIVRQLGGPTRRASAPRSAAGAGTAPASRAQQPRAELRRP